MSSYRNLIEGAKVIKPSTPEIVAALKQGKGEIMAKSGLEFNRAGVQLKYIFKYKGRWVIDTEHAAERRVQRGSVSLKEMETFFKNMIDTFLSEKRRGYNFLIFSRKLNQGIVIDYRLDYKKIDAQKHFIIVTFLPKGKSQPKSGTAVILIEKLFPGYNVIVCD
jgi:hypothetical protein